ncbi:MAG: hypothetical protein NTW49_03600 [Bacteroidia bacterium]|nr:hypothetical protein [Bacteroidia bacterium]
MNYDVHDAHDVHDVHDAHDVHDVHDAHDDIPDTGYPFVNSQKSCNFGCRIIDVTGKRTIIKYSEFQE